MCRNTRNHTSNYTSVSKTHISREGIIYPPRGDRAADPQSPESLPPYGLGESPDFASGLSRELVSGDDALECHESLLVHSAVTVHQDHFLTFLTASVDPCSPSLGRLGKHGECSLYWLRLSGHLLTGDNYPPSFVSAELPTNTSVQPFRSRRNSTGGNTRIME